MISNQRAYNQKYTFDNNYFDQIDSEDKAYFLGFLFADGYAAPHRHEITWNIQEDDSYIIQKFLGCIHSNHHLTFYPKIGPKRKNQYRLTIIDEYFYHKLNSYGLIPGKSVLLTQPINNILLTNMKIAKHFIRGFYDGNGSFSYFNNGQYTRYILHIDSTEDFLSYINNCLRQQLNFQGYLGKSHSQHKHLKVLGLSGYLRCKALLDWLYKDATIYLIRKHDNYVKYLVNASDDVVKNSAMRYKLDFTKKQLLYIINSPKTNAVLGRELNIKPKVISNIRLRKIVKYNKLLQEN